MKGYTNKVFRTFTGLFVTIGLIVPSTLIAQNSGPSLGVDKKEAAVSDTLDGWNLNLMAGLNGSQNSFNNWSQGGVNSISGTAMTWFEAHYRNDRFGYLFNTNLKYGKARLEGKETRKTSDQLSVKNKFTYDFQDSRFSLYGNVDFSSQFDEGIDYSDSTEPVISRFMAPGFFRQSVGLSYEPLEFLTFETGIGFKQTYMRDTDLSTRYGLDPGEKFRFEAGGVFNVTAEKQIMKNIKYRSSFESFANFQQSFKYTDFEFSNQVVGSINEYINTTFEFVIVYDRDYSSELQIKQMLSAGLQLNIL